MSGILFFIFASCHPLSKFGSLNFLQIKSPFYNKGDIECILHVEFKYDDKNFKFEKFWKKNDNIDRLSTLDIQVERWVTNIPLPTNTTGTNGPTLK